MRQAYLIEDGDDKSALAIIGAAAGAHPASPLPPALLLPVVVLLRQVRSGGRRQEPLLRRLLLRHILHLLLPLLAVINESTLFEIFSKWLSCFFTGKILTLKAEPLRVGKFHYHGAWHSSSSTGCYFLRSGRRR